MQDRITRTTTFTAPSVAAARARLERELDTGVLVVPHQGIQGSYDWAAKFARAWGRIVDNPGCDDVIVEVTRASDRVPIDADEQTALSKLIVQTRNPTGYDSILVEDCEEFDVPPALYPVIWHIMDKTADGMFTTQALNCTLAVLRVAAEVSMVRAAINNAATSILLTRDLGEDDNRG